MQEKNRPVTKVGKKSGEKMKIRDKGKQMMRAN